jgi:hypothetical protein
MADSHTEDGILPGLTLRAIDRKTGIKGFGSALCAVGWLEDSSDGVCLVNFEEHNGTSAKRRCTDAQTKASKRKSSAEVPANVGEMSASHADKNGTREEKRRELDIGDSGGDCENPFTTPTDTPEQINPIARYPATVQEQARRILSGWHFWRYGSLPNLSSDSTIGNLNTIAATVESFGDSVEAKMGEFMQKPPPGFPRTAPLFRIFKHLGLEAPNHEPVQPPRRTNHAGRGSPMSAGGGRYEGIKPVIAD